MLILDAWYPRDDVHSLGGDERNRESAHQEHPQELAHAEDGVGSEPDVRGHDEGADTKVVRTGEAAS